MNKVMNKVTSTDIKLALKEVNLGRKTYFITECKTCSTYFPDPQGLLIFDAIAILKSYTKPCITGYEIKVSRNDFLQDNKWHLYLQYCNEFYFVVPNGLVKKDELPDNVGLIYYNPEKKTLRTVKKAQYRLIDPPVGMYEYIIYSRLEEDRIPFYEKKAEYAKAYLEDKGYKRYIGQLLGSKMAQDIEEAYSQLDKVKYKSNAINCWEKVEKILKEHDLFGWNYYRDSNDETWLENLEKALNGSYPKKIYDEIAILKSSIKRLEKTIEKSDTSTPTNIPTETEYTN